MRVGVPKEIKPSEFRVALTPAGVREFVERGHDVLVQAGAGAGIGADDDAFRAAGAVVVASAQEVFDGADLVVKVKEPQPAECAMLRRGQILFTYLHLAPDPGLTRRLLDSGVTGVAYETVTGAGGGLPLLAPMSEVAGRLAIQAAARFMEEPAGGQGLLLGGVPGVAPARVVVIGGGVVGTQAARMALGLGARVTVLDRSVPRLRQLDDLFGGRADTIFATRDAVEQAVIAADAVIGAVLIPGASAPKLVGRGMLARMKRGAVLVDVAIDQGGCFETSRPTTHADPVYVIDGVLHYCVANMPGAVPRTSSHALVNATLPHALAIAGGGLGAILADPDLRAGLNVHDGKVTHAAVADSLGLQWHDPAALRT
jgi:alanine dehydrogenase